MLSKKFITGIAIALIIYGSAVGFWAWLNHTELYSIAVCCGLYGDYELYYLPLPKEPLLTNKFTKFENLIHKEGAS